MEIFASVDSLLLLTLLVVPLSAVLVASFSSRARKNSSAGDHGVLKSYPIIGHLPHVAKNRHRLLEWTTDVLASGPTRTVVLTVFGPSVLTADPANVEHMLKAGSGKYQKSAAAIAIFEDFLGRGIFNSNGEQWRWQRKAASLQFNNRSLRDFVAGAVQYELARPEYTLVSVVMKIKGGLPVRVLKREG